MNDLFASPAAVDFEARAVVPARELAAYEALWAHGAGLDPRRRHQAIRDSRAPCHSSGSRLTSDALQALIEWLVGYSPMPPRELRQCPGCQIGPDGHFDVSLSMSACMRCLYSSDQ